LWHLSLTEAGLTACCYSLLRLYWPVKPSHLLCQLPGVATTLFPALGRELDIPALKHILESLTDFLSTGTILAQLSDLGLNLLDPRAAQ